MNLPLSLSASDVHQIASSGSPALIQIVGRAFGLGQAERDALSQGKIPGWFWATAGLAVGLVAGIQVYKRWPNQVPKFIKGGR